jgi:hypothetical protein
MLEDVSVRVDGVSCIVIDRRAIRSVSLGTGIVTAVAGSSTITGIVDTVAF